MEWLVHVSPITCVHTKCTLPHGYSGTQYKSIQIASFSTDTQPASGPSCRMLMVFLLVCLHTHGSLCLTYHLQPPCLFSAHHWLHPDIPSCQPSYHFSCKPSWLSLLWIVCFCTKSQRAHPFVCIMGHMGSQCLCYAGEDMIGLREPKKFSSTQAPIYILPTIRFLASGQFYWPPSSKNVCTTIIIWSWWEWLGSQVELMVPSHYILRPARVRVTFWFFSPFYPLFWEKVFFPVRFIVSLVFKIGDLPSFMFWFYIIVHMFTKIFWYPTFFFLL